MVAAASSSGLVKSSSQWASGCVSVRILCIRRARRFRASGVSTAGTAVRVTSRAYCQAKTFFRVLPLVVIGSVACRHVSFPVTLAVVGAGGRGSGYANWALEHPDRARVVAVAEPRDARRARFAAAHGIAPENVVTDWRALAERRTRVADAVLICTQDRMHVEPAIAFAEAGY